jgi:hypothetical protein
MANPNLMSDRVVRFKISVDSDIKQKKLKKITLSGIPGSGNGTVCRVTQTLGIEIVGPATEPSICLQQLNVTATRALTLERRF